MACVALEEEHMKNSSDPGASTLRKLLAGAAAAVVIAIGATAARAGDSYISLQGTFSAPSQMQMFDFSLGANALMLARTWGNPGGTNAAGESIAGNGIDSTLTLFNSVMVQIAADDDGGGGLNSQIANIYP